MEQSTKKRTGVILAAATAALFTSGAMAIEEARILPIDEDNAGQCDCSDNNGCNGKTDEDGKDGDSCRSKDGSQEKN